ncbi:hypothetical protein IWW38_002855 [Coemansia aciculifera]|uniref:Uncharacterized protein n=1 Tax=Coemansia aciculifera TaxID=417176 RepID=A0ACC1M2D0_9FUNG|nr:hypothetical protein IWW38_002855 [Coemansia aciculifera]
MAQLIAGAWSFAANNGLGAVVYTSYGCYWMSYAATLIPGFGISDALNSVSAEVRGQSWGIFNLVWTIQTFIFLLASLRSNWGTVISLLLLLVTYTLSTIGHWAQSDSFMHASGYVGLITSIVAWYNVAADMLNKETFYCELPNPSIGMRHIAPDSPGLYSRDLSVPSTANHLDGRTPGNNYDFIATIPKHTVAPSADIS